MILVFYISGHGLGHASREIEVINNIRRRQPDTRIVVRTSAPRWFFDTFTQGPIDLQPVEVDTGVTQIDSLQLDIADTARRSAHFYAGFGERVEEEAALLLRLGASLVIGDIPPLAFAAAARAGVPSVALGNFTWDWIYAGYTEFGDDAPGVIEVIADAYSKATYALRLPFHGGFEPMAGVTRDIPLIARHADRPRAETRRTLGISADAVVVLASFGRYPLRLPYDDVARAGPFTLVVTDREMEEDVPSRPAAGGGLRRFEIAALARQDFHYPDLVAAADVVVSKPGYGIVSECIANGAALLYTDRERFPEHDVFVAEMPRTLRCRFISQQDLLAGRWREAIDALLGQPLPGGHLDTTGAGVAAAAILGIANPELDVQNLNAQA